MATILTPLKNKYDILDDWFNTAQGRRVADAFTLELKDISQHISGNRMMQLGSCGENNWLSILKFKQRFLVSPSINTKKANFFAEINNLPIDRDSIDCVLAPLTMELFAKADDPLDEIDRILKSRGFIIFFGINPCSFWGGAAFFRKLSCFENSRVELRNSLTIYRSLFNRGYRQCYMSSFFYIPPIKNEKLIHGLEFLNEMGKMIWPYPASFYCFVAQKNDLCYPFVENEQENMSIAKAIF